MSKDTMMGKLEEVDELIHKAVDKLTVSLECAIELTEKSKHDDLD